MTLQKKALKQKAHTLKPVILLGQQGLTPAVQLEIERALLAHELVKIKIPGENREERQAIIETICTEREAELIQSIGKTLVIYREKEEKETKPHAPAKRITRSRKPAPKPKHHLRRRATNR